MEKRKPTIIGVVRPAFIELEVIDQVLGVEVLKQYNTWCIKNPVPYKITINDMVCTTAIHFKEFCRRKRIPILLKNKDVKNVSMPADRFHNPFGFQYVYK